MPLKPVHRVVPLQASRWLTVGALLDTDELALLLNELGDLSLIRSGRVVARGEERLSISQLTELYAAYVASLKSGAVPNALFSACFTRDPDSIAIQPVGTERILARPVRPVIQLRPFTLSYSAVDGKFREMVRGSSAITWGLQFGYPQLFQEPNSGQIVSCATLPNSEPFRRLQRWMRKSTRATPFVVGGRRTHSTARLGRSCFEWIRRHPQLVQQRIEVSA